MPDTQTAPKVAPKYAHYRQAKAAVDTLPEINGKHGCNTAQYERVHVQVVPSGGADPTVAVLWWSQAAGKFVQEHVPLTMDGVGVNTPYEFTVESRGRIMFVAVTEGLTLAAHTADIYVAGYGLNHTL